VVHFRSDAKNVAVLNAAKIDLVSIANNHALDYEYDALLEMLGLLELDGIAHAGAGQNRIEAWRPATLIWEYCCLLSAAKSSCPIVVHNNDAWSRK
jgi:poly-gamma-glutamate synthesis protein (capsule biosynthesis protein)